jgi:hypothetical protein
MLELALDVGDNRGKYHCLWCGVLEERLSCCLSCKSTNMVCNSPSTKEAGSAAAVVGGGVGRSDDQNVAIKDGGGQVESLAGGLSGIVCAGNAVAGRMKEAANMLGGRLTKLGK